MADARAKRITGFRGELEFERPAGLRRFWQEAVGAFAGPEQAHQAVQHRHIGTAGALKKCRPLLRRLQVECSFKDLFFPIHLAALRDELI